MRPFIAAVSRRMRRAGSAVARVRPGTAASPDVVNLAPNPAFRSTGSTARVDGVPAEVRLFDQPFEAGGVHVAAHTLAYAAPVPGRPGVTGVLLAGTGDGNDTYVAPGGCDGGGFRLDMRAGGTYTAGVSVWLPAPLTGPLHPTALRIVVDCVRGDKVRRAVAQSLPARNEFGDHRITVTFTLPPSSTAAWLRLVGGMSHGHGSVHWHSLTLTATEHPVPYFDGDDAGDVFHDSAWLGAPNASPSRRWLRDPAAVTADLGPRAGHRLADEAVRLAAAGRRAESDTLLHYLAARRDPAYPVVAARRLLALGEEGPARSALRAVVRTGDETGDAAFELGLLADGRQAWRTAEESLRTAFEKQPDSSVRAYRLARVLDRLGRRDDSRRTSAAGLRHDTDLPFDGPAVLGMDVKCFGARRDVGVFVAAHLDEIRTMARQRLQRSATSTLRRPVFVYWAQGFDAAPVLVRRCLAQLRAVDPDADIHELTDATVPYYVDVPADLSAAVGDNKTHFSDLLRLILLEKYGGAWVDATAFVTEPLAPRLTELLAPSSIFAFHYTGPYISSWFLACRPDSLAMHLWRAAVFLWWEKGAGLIDYFLIHHVFEMLHHLADEFAAEWDKGVRLGSRPAHALQNAMLQPFDAAACDTMLAGSFVHKLRYKYQPHEVTSDSYLAHLMRGEIGR